MHNIGLQLYGIRDCFTDETHIRRALKEVAAMGYTQVQTAGFFIGVEAFADAIKEAGLEVVGTHYDWEILRTDMNRALREHARLGTSNVGIGGMPGEYRGSVAATEAFIREANRLAAELAAHGCKFTYHNHDFEFRRLEDGRTAMEHLIDGLDPDNISFVLDVYWVQHAGADVRRMIERLAGRIDILHLKDMGLTPGESVRPCITEIGSGNMDFRDITATADAAGVRYYVVEQDDNFAVDPMTSARTSFRYLADKVFNEPARPEPLPR